MSAKLKLDGKDVLFACVFRDPGDEQAVSFHVNPDVDLAVLLEAMEVQVTGLRAQWRLRIQQALAAQGAK